MVVLITGCRSGFGRLMAIEAGKKGHVVYAGLRDLDTAETLVAGSQGLYVRPVQLDVTSSADRKAVIAGIIAEHGRIEGLVNNAGVALGGFLEQVDEDELRRVFEVNVFGLWALTNEVLPHMRSQKAGKIVNISSGSGFMAFPGLGAYASSKFALEGMTEAWRHELSLFGIDIYLIQPGAYATDIWGRNRRLCRRSYEAGEYLVWVNRMDSAFRDMVSKAAKEPDEVAVRTVQLLERGRMSFRHPMGPGTLRRRILKGIVPFRWVELLIRRFLSKGTLKS